jgi:osmoprotectant transport system permease protein
MLDRILPLVASHILIASAALALGLLLALPLGVFAARHRRVEQGVLGFASLVQTIPSLALLALFYPLLLAIRTLTGAPISPLGFLPALLALTLYALLPILRNTVVGLRGLDPDMLEAADGVGMTAWQKLWLVEAPTALPTVMAGIRTAAVWTIGAATLSTTVGQPSLGDVIFSGLQTQNWELVIWGCLAAAALALTADALLALAERGISKGPRILWVVALALFVAAPVAALVSQIRPAQPTVTIGAKSFAEQYILARLIGHRLEAAGYAVRYKENLGSAVVFGAVTSGEVDLYVDYAGTLWTNEMKRTDNPPRAAMVAGVTAWTKAQRGVTTLGPLGFENAYALAMQGPTARAKGIASIDDLRAAGGSLTLGADLEFLDRPEWATIRKAYDLRFARQRTFNPTFMYDALTSGDADVISAFSSDGRIAADGLVVLTDPRGAIPSYDALLLVGPKAARDAKLVATLRSLIGAIRVDAMRQANFMVDRATDKSSPDVAARWLDAHIAIGR